MSEYKIFKENVWHFIENLQNLRTKCKFCGKNYALDVQCFRGHVEEKHRDVLIDMINKNRKETPDEYVKYDRVEPRCVICKKKVELENFRDHLNSHTLDDLIKYHLENRRIAKYGRAKDCRVYCNFCPGHYLIKVFYKCIYQHMKAHHEKKLCDKIYSLKHSLPLQLDAKCMPSNIANQSDQFEKYIKLKDNFLAECTICEREFTYVDIQHFRAHLFEHNEQHEQKFIIKTKKYRKKTPERYFFKLKCLICSKDEFGSFSKHLKSRHLVEIKYYEIMKHTWEYCSKHDNFAVQCNFCPTTVTLTISKTVKDHIDVHMTEQLARNKEEIASSSETDNIQKLPSKITNESELWENYTKLESFQAKCQFCDFQDSYINLTKFNQHVEEIHLEVLLFEASYGEEWPGIYFNFNSDYGNTLRCLLCNGDVMYQTSDDWDQHLRKNHSFNKIDCYLYNCGWEWKYCDKIGDVEVKCNICHEEISLEVELSQLQRHIEKTHLINRASTQEIHDITGPSGSQLN